MYYNCGVQFKTVLAFANCCALLPTVASQRINQEQDINIAHYSPLKLLGANSPWFKGMDYLLAPTNIFVKTVI